MAKDKNHSVIVYDKDRATEATNETNSTVKPVFNGPVGRHVQHGTVEGGFTIIGRNNNTN